MKKIIYIIIGLLAFNVSLFNIKALGASANTTSTTVGSNVVVTIDASGYAGSFSITSSNSGVLSGGSNNTWIDDSKQTFVFKAQSAGSATITVKGTAASYASGADENLSKSITVNVGAKAVVNLSNDNYLKALSVEGHELSQAFSKDTLEYGVELEPDTTSINIVATANHSGATVSGAGTVEVQDGDNRIEIVVTAENGSQRKYIINANVKEYDPITVKVDNSDYTLVRKKGVLTAPTGYEETTVTIDGNEIPAFKSKVTGYTLVGLKDSNGNTNLYVYKDKKYTLYKEYTFNKVVLYPLQWNKKDIPDNYKKYTITYNDEKIEAYKLKKSSKYALIYGMNVETGEKHIYMYDANEDTLQIYNDEEVKVIKKQNSLYLKIAIGLGSLSIVLLIIMLVSLIKKTKKLKVKQMNK